MSQIQADKQVYTYLEEEKTFTHSKQQDLKKKREQYAVA